MFKSKNKKKCKPNVKPNSSAVVTLITQMIYRQLNDTINLEEVRRAIENSKNGKSTGIDNIPNEILKNPKLHYPLHKLYKYCFENSGVPDCWYRSIVQPIHKKGKDP